jgi:hypothetical protein
MDITAKRSIRIGNDWFEDNIGETFYIGPLPKSGAISHNKGTFVPQRILLNGAANYEQVEGILWDENETDFQVYTLEVGRVHPLAFRAIRESKTTAREISILS